MKKNLWLLGVAVAAFTSCTQSEVLEVPESRTIQFDTFVGKSTRAAIPINTFVDADYTGNAPATELHQFWVYGIEDSQPLFNGTDTDAKVYYSNKLHGFTYDVHKMWNLGSTYSFAAYSNGNTPLVVLNSSNPYSTQVSTAPTNISFEEIKDATTQALTGSKLVFSNYEVGDYDLLAAIVPTTNLPEHETSISDVPLYFQHMLSMIDIHLKNNTREEYILIDDIKFNGVKKDKCTYSINIDKEKNIVWDNATASSITDAMKGDYIMKGTPITASGYDSAPDDDKKNEDNYLGPGETLTLTYFVIPQKNQSFTDINLKMHAYKKETSGGVDTFVEATNDPVDKKMSLKVTTAGHESWQPGYVYNYSGSLDGIAHYIHFDVMQVIDWSANSVNVNGTGSNIQ